MLSPGNHVLANVSEPRAYEYEGKPYKSYTLRFNGDEGTYSLSKKADSPAPTPGQTLDVKEVIPPKEGTTFPPKIKLNYGAGAAGRGGGMTPEREAVIVRQHSQTAAIQFVGLMIQANALPDGTKVNRDLIKGLADWFDADAKAAKP